MVEADAEAKADPELVPLVLDGLHAARTGQFPNGLAMEAQTELMGMIVRRCHQAIQAIARAQIDVQIACMKAMAGVSGGSGKGKKQPRKGPTKAD